MPCTVLYSTDQASGPVVGAVNGVGLQRRPVVQQAVKKARGVPGKLVSTCTH